MAQSTQSIHKILSCQSPDHPSSELSYLCLLEEGGKKVRRSESELLKLAPKLISDFKKPPEIDLSGDTSDEEEEEVEVVVKRRSSARESSEKEKEKEKAVDIKKRAKEIKAGWKSKPDPMQEDGEEEDEEEEEDGEAESYDEQGEEESSASEEEEASSEDDKPRRSSRAPKKLKKPKSPMKPRKSTRSTRHQKAFPVEGEIEEDEVEVGVSKRRTRSSKSRSRSNSDESGSEDELALGAESRRKKRKNANGKAIVVDASDDDSDDVMVMPVKWVGKDLPQNKHRATCVKCGKKPADELKKALAAKRKAPGRKRKRNHENADLEDDSDAELERIEKMGAWLECDVCIVSSHFGCLPLNLQKEFVNSLKADHEAHYPPPPPPAPVFENGMEVDQPPPPPRVVPKRVKIEFDSHRKFTLPKCASCKKAGGRRCFLCGISGRKAGVKKDSKDMDVDPDTELVIPPLMFRCIGCKRTAHYNCLPREDDDETITLEAHAQSYNRDGQCHQCWSYTSPLDVILAWTEEEIPEGGEVQDDDDDDIVQEGVVMKDEKTGKEFILPSAKDPSCKAQYLVKWQGQSYRSLEWVPHGYLAATYNSKLANFLVKGSLINFDARLEDSEGEPEIDSRPKADIGSAPHPDPDAADRIPKAWSTVDRVLDVWYVSKTKPDEMVRYEDYRKLPRDPEESVKLVAECFFKWGDLAYSASTTEAPPEPEEEEYEAYVRAYKAFLIACSSGMRVPTLNSKQLAELNKTRDEAKFQPLTKQPAHIVGGTLMPFQLEGVNFLFFQWWKRTGCILADEMGLGKTVQIITLLSTLNKDQGARPFLVAVPNSTLGNWIREFARWAPELRVVPYGGDAKSREIVEQYELFDSTGKVLKTHVVLATYEALEKNISVFRKVARWDCCVIDEGQRLKSGPGGLLYDALCTLNINHRILLTGTPLNNNIRELFALLHFIDPENYGDLAALEEEYAELTPEKVEKIRAILKPYFLRRTKELVLDLPALTELVVPVTMTLLQRQLYRNLLEKNAAAIESVFHKTSKRTKVKKASFNNLLMQLRKLLGHPYLVSPEIEPLNVSAEQSFTSLTEASAKLLLLSKLLPKLRAAGHRVLIFSQFKLCLNILEDFLSGLNLKYSRFDGDTAQLDRQRGIDAFQKEGSDIFCYLLSTRAGGVGINLTTADTVIMFDQDFNPHQDVQAIARAHRIGQKHPVRVFKLMVKFSCEEKIFQAGTKKLGLDHVIIQRLDADKEESEEIESILQYGAKAIFSDQESDANEIKYSDEDIDTLLARSAEASDSPRKEGAAATFAQAKIWELKRDEAVAVNADEQEENLHDFWAGILREQEEKDRAAKAAAAQNLGRDRRAKRKVSYQDRGADESPEKPSSKKNGKSAANSKESDDEFQEAGASGSDSDDDSAIVVERDDLTFDSERRRVTGLAKPVPGDPPAYPTSSVLPTSFHPIPPPSHVGSTSGAPLVNATKKKSTVDSALRDLRAQKAAQRHQNIQAMARSAKQFHDERIDDLLRRALVAPVDIQKHLIIQAAQLLRELSAKHKVTAPLAPKPAVANGQNRASFPNFASRPQGFPSFDRLSW